MTQQPDDQQEPHDAVRRLLAEARHDQPLPLEVAQRLDTLLGRLVEERTAGARTDQLAPRRHRSRLVVLAAAAAVVVAVGAGGVATRVLDGGPDAGGAGDSSASSAQDAPAVPERAPQDDGGGTTTQEAPDAATPVSGALVLTEAGFDAEVQAAVGPELDRAYSSELTLLPDGCVLPGDLAVLAAVTYDGAAGVLALGEPEGGGRRIDLWLCGGSAPARTTTAEAGPGGTTGP